MINSLNFQRLYFFGFIIAGIVFVLTGCSATSALSALTGTKPEITAQAGAENVKQTVGVTAKQDTSSKQETTIKDSKVDKVDLSSKKQIRTASIQGNDIKAESFQVVNSSDNCDEIPLIAFSFLCVFFAGFGTAKLTNKKAG